MAGPRDVELEVIDPKKALLGRCEEALKVGDNLLQGLKIKKFPGLKDIKAKIEKALEPIEELKNTLQDELELEQLEEELKKPGAIPLLDVKSLKKQTTLLENTLETLISIESEIKKVVAEKAAAAATSPEVPTDAGSVIAYIQANALEIYDQAEKSVRDEISSGIYGADEIAKKLEPILRQELQELLNINLLDLDDANYNKIRDSVLKWVAPFVEGEKQQHCALIQQVLLSSIVPEREQQKQATARGGHMREFPQNQEAVIKNINDLAKLTIPIEDLIKRLNDLIIENRLSDKQIAYSTNEQGLASWNMGCGTRWVHVEEVEGEESSTSAAIYNPEYQPGPPSTIDSAIHAQRMTCCAAIVNALQQRKLVVALQEAPKDTNDPFFGVAGATANTQCKATGNIRTAIAGELKPDPGEILQIAQIALKSGIEAYEYQIGKLPAPDGRLIVSIHFDWQDPTKNPQARQNRCDFLKALSTLDNPAVVMGDSNIPQADLRRVLENVGQASPLETHGVRGTASVDVIISPNIKNGGHHTAADMRPTPAVQVQAVQAPAAVIDTDWDEASVDEKSPLLQTDSTTTRKPLPKTESESAKDTDLVPLDSDISALLPDVATPQTLPKTGSAKDTDLVPSDALDAESPQLTREPWDRFISKNLHYYEKRLNALFKMVEAAPSSAFYREKLPKIEKICDGFQQQLEVYQRKSVAAARQVETHLLAIRTIKGMITKTKASEKPQAQIAIADEETHESAKNLNDAADKRHAYFGSQSAQSGGNIQSQPEAQRTAPLGKVSNHYHPMSAGKKGEIIRTATTQYVDPENKALRADFYFEEDFKDKIKNIKRERSGFTTIPGAAIMSWANAKIDTFLAHPEAKPPIKINGTGLPHDCIEALIISCQFRGVDYTIPKGKPGHDIKVSDSQVKMLGKLVKEEGGISLSARKLEKLEKRTIDEADRPKKPGSGSH